MIKIIKLHQKKKKKKKKKVIAQSAASLQRGPGYDSKRVMVNECPGYDSKLPTSVLDMTVNNVMVKPKCCWSFGECGVSLHCHCSQVHSGPEW